MGTWVKETDEAIYLMQGNQWISKIVKKPSKTNPKEQVLNVEGMRTWFTRSDFPGAMTVSVGVGGPEPEQAGTESGTPPEQPESSGGSEVVPDNPGDGSTSTPDSGGSNHRGMQLRVKNSTWLKLKPKMASELTDAEKVVVSTGRVLDIEYYADVGGSHWLIELLEPIVGDRKTTSWYVYTPDTELLTNMFLKVKADTFFKAEAKMSSQLSDSQKVFVKAGTTHKLIQSKPAAGDHLEVDLADASFGPENQKTWYVYQPHTEVEGKRQILEIVSDTLFKSEPVQSSQLPDSDKVFVKKGTTFLLNSYANPDKNHVKVALQGAFLGPKSLTTWYAYLPDIAISGTEIGNHPDDQNPGQPANPVDRGIPLRFPGFTGTYYSNDPIQFNNKFGERGNFTWAEALHVNPSTGAYRKPASSGVVYGILKVVDALEDIRRMYGNRPMRINSWYRDPATNAAVGGASMSRHLSGDAVDFVFAGISPFDVYARLNPWWGSRGGLASSSVFTHIDVRGYRARWSYGY
jgi:uncharacterized protein YcbK (DUF882 family)